MPLVSVIIPIYNAEKYMNRCIDAVLNQKYKNIEVILINDGSVDSSKKICQKYCEKDNRVICISKNNEGVSKARNAGIKIATGKYLCFIDADDWIDIEYVEEYVLCAEDRDADLVIGSYISEYNDYKVEKVKDEKYHKKLLSQNEALKKILSPKGINGTVWAKMFERKIVNEHNLQFETDIRVGEDLLFVFRYIKYFKTIISDPKKMYHYLIHSGSALHSEIQSVEDKRFDIVKVWETIIGESIDLDLSVKEMIISIYVRELSEAYCNVYRFNNENINLYYKSNAHKYMKKFLIGKTFNPKTKIVTILKFLCPKIIMKLK